MERSLAKRRKTVKLLRDVYRIIDRHNTGHVPSSDFLGRLNSMKVTLKKEELDGLMDRYCFNDMVDFTKALQEIQVRQTGDFESWYVGKPPEEDPTLVPKQTRNLNVSPENALAYTDLKPNECFDLQLSSKETTNQARKLAKAMQTEGVTAKLLQNLQRVLLKADRSQSGMLHRMIFSKALPRLPVSEEVKHQFEDYVCGKETCAVLTKVSVLLRLMEVTQLSVKPQSKHALIQTSQHSSLKSTFANKLKEKFLSFASAFRKLDWNQDGFIDLDEFQEATFKLGLLLSHQERLDLFASLDRSKRGKLDYSDFAELLGEPGSALTLPKLQQLPTLESKVKSTRFNESFEVNVSSVKSVRSRYLPSNQDPTFAYGRRANQVADIKDVLGHRFNRVSTLNRVTKGHKSSSPARRHFYSPMK